MPCKKISIEEMTVLAPKTGGYFEGMLDPKKGISVSLHGHLGMAKKMGFPKAHGKGVMGHLEQHLTTGGRAFFKVELGG